MKIKKLKLQINTYFVVSYYFDVTILNHADLKKKLSVNRLSLRRRLNKVFKRIA